MTDTVESGARVDAATDTPVTAHEDVTYAERETGELKLDLYVPQTDGQIPLVVYVHGGGWVFETRKNAPDLERFAGEWGCAIASVSYRLARIPDDVQAPFQIDPENTTPRGVFPDQIVDVKAAIRWLRAHAKEYGFDADRVATWGASAGGHLASLAGVLDDVTEVAGDVFPAEAVEKDVAAEQSGGVQAVVDWYGVTDFTTSSRDEDDPSAPEALLLGGPLADNREAARRASPATYVGSESPPFHIVHGQADQVVPIEHSRQLFDALRDVKVDATLFELHDTGHVFDADSERTAMEQLTADPRTGQSVLASAHSDRGATDDSLFESIPPAGPDAIGQFLDRTLR